MGYNIKVDHSKFTTAASAIEAYNSKMITKMNKADTVVQTMMSGNWKGADATAFRTKWNGVKGTDSVYYKMKSSMSSYAKTLKAARDKYKKAQADAVNRAKKLKTW